MSAEQSNQRQWDEILEMTKAAQERGADPLVWAVELTTVLNAFGVSVPSIEVAEMIVSHICWSNNVPIAWKYLEKALSIRVVPPMFVLALLSARVTPSRWEYPAAYRLYIELLKRYAFSLPSLISCPDYPRIMTSIADVLQFSHVYEIQSSEPGLLVVQFLFSIVWKLLDASLEDEGLSELTPETKSRWPAHNQDMDIDHLDGFEGKRMEQTSALSKANTVMAIEVIGIFFQDKKTSRILYLAQKNMPTQWDHFARNIRLLASNSTALRSSKNLSPESILQSTSDVWREQSHYCKTNSLKHFHAVTSIPTVPSSAQCHGTFYSALWLPIDLYLVDIMDGLQVQATGAADALRGLLKALQALNQATWRDSFLGLWTSLLRLVQMEINSSEGPVPRMDTCLCLLLSIATLTVVKIVEEEETVVSSEADVKSRHRKNTESVVSRRAELVSSLKCLGNFQGLLTRPPPVCSLANQAYAKAVLFLNKNAGSAFLDGISSNDLPLNFSGNLWHLIVEACIARDILDTSAYLWPGYVSKDLGKHIPRNVSIQVPSWSSLMSGSPLTPQLVSVLVSTPANSLAEIERMYEIAVSGTDDEKISAAMILCGASLSRGWNIQEHTTLLIIRLLSPDVPVNFSGSESHLIGYAPFLNVLLLGISSVDCIQIFSLHGLVPQLAAVLMSICEVFGSCSPTVTWRMSTGEEISPRIVFSNVFTLLLKLWRFDRPPLESVMGDVTPVVSRSFPECLLLVRNAQLASNEDRSNCSKSSRLLKSPPPPRGPVFMDSFPKLMRWHRRNQECIVSTLSGLVAGDPVHQIVESLLGMMFRKTTASSGEQQSNNSSSASGGSDDSFSLHLKLPAWDILDAVPYVLDAALTALAHGKLTPRELTTGLKDLVDFLPASLASVVSYFSAEVTRGLWKPACMNGTDWPSPATNLSAVEQQIKQILAATGVNVPSLPIGGSSPVTIPLPLAVLLSLTIMFKVDRDVGRNLYLVAPALSRLGTSCPWPCMPIITSLWALKAKRWSDFLVFSASQTVFYHSNEAVVQLLRVCFSTVVGLNSASSPSSVESKGSVGALLGHGFGCGILYLRVHRSIRNVFYVTEAIVSLLMQTVRDVVADRNLAPEKMERLRRAKHGTKSGHVSLVAAVSQVKLAASLGASLVWISGGLNAVHSLIKEILPSWFISKCGDGSASSSGGGGGGIVGPMLSGYALAYLVVYAGAFAWGVDSAAAAAAKLRGKAVEEHLEFLGSTMDGKVSVGCGGATWRAYVTGWLGLVVKCAPEWLAAGEVDVEVVKRVCRGLRKEWGGAEEQLCIELLEACGVAGVGAAAEIIIVSAGE